MKKTKKLFSALLALLMTCALLVGVTAVAGAANPVMFITLRVEGVEANLYYETLEISYKDTLTVKDALAKFDKQVEELTFVGLEDGVVTAVNDEVNNAFEEDDCWHICVNDKAVADDLGTVNLANNDSIVLYYGTADCLYPVVESLTVSADGIIGFYSHEVVYDEEAKADVDVYEPIVGALVSWDDNVFYATDEAGQIYVGEDVRTPGRHSLQIEKADMNGVPRVCRLAPDYSVRVSANGGSNFWTTISTFVINVVRWLLKLVFPWYGE